MQRLTTGVLWSLLVTLALSTTGCGTIAKQAFHEVLGARGKLYFNNDVPPHALAYYQSVEFTPTSTELSTRLCRPAALHYCDRYARKVQADLSDVYPGGEPRLTIDIDVLYVHTKDLLKAAQLLARVKMRNGDRVVVDAILNTQSKAFREGNEEKLAEAGLKTIETYLRQHKQTELEANADDK